MELVDRIAALVAGVQVVLDAFFFMEFQGVQGKGLQQVFRMAGVAGVIGVICWVIRSHGFPILCVTSASPDELWS